MKNELKPEISWQWQSNEKHANTVKQTLELFSKVNVVLSKHESEKLKFNVKILIFSKKKPKNWLKNS